MGANQTEPPWPATIRLSRENTGTAMREMTQFKRVTVNGKDGW
jgi:hypothetical protein